jgi:hypothetical protein
MTRAKRFYLWPRWFWRFPMPLMMSGAMIRRAPYKIGFSWLWWERGETI